MNNLNLPYQNHKSLKRILKICGLALIIACASLPYLGSLYGEFVYDDIPLIVNDPFYLNESNPILCWSRGFWQKNRSQGLYRPLTVFTFWLNTKTTGLNPFFFRLTNIALNAGIAILVWKYAMRLRLGAFSAFFAAIIFGLHPIHSEAIAPAFGRGELLCTFFLILGLIFHSRISRSKLYGFPAGVSFLLSCWSKEHGVVFIPLCLVQDYYLSGLRISQIWEYLRKLYDKIPVYLTYLLFFAIFLFSRYAVFGTFIPDKGNFEPAIDNVLAITPQPYRTITAISLQGFALKLILYPEILSHDYSFAQILPSQNLMEPKFLITLLLFFGFPSFVAILIPRLRGIALFFPIVYAVSIIPASNIIITSGTIFAERLFYFPSIWPIFFFTAFFLRISQKIGKVGYIMIGILFFAIIIACSYRTVLRVEEWNSEISLAEAGIRTAPKSAKTWNNLAIQLEKVGDLEAAVICAGKAIELYPRYSTAFANRGLWLAKLRRFEEAEKNLKTAIELHSRNMQARHNLGALLANQGRLEEAEKVWEESLTIDPEQKEITALLERLREQILLQKK